MKNKLFFIVCFATFISCSTSKSILTNSDMTSFQYVTIDTILKDEISIRALVLDKKNLYYGADKSRFGCINLKSKNKYEKKITANSSVLEFRSCAQNSKNVFLISIGNPAFLYKISKDSKELKLVYQENGEKVFYDSMQFWNNTEGIAIGDPTENCFSIIKTHDGGATWTKLSCTELPKLYEGEAAFAASNTTIIVKGNNTWLVSGGKKARVFYSPDKAKSWQVFETPITQGNTMTGIFSADFYNDTIGFAAGGNYENQSQNSGNKAFTIDGGKNWNLIAENKSFGYTSCVQYIPESNGKQLVSVGTSGLYYSSDSGENWTQFSTNKNLYTIRFLNSNTAYAAGKNGILKINFH